MAAIAGPVSKYIVVTCVFDNNKDLHNPVTYDWIFPQDSINGNKTIPYPFYLESISEDHLSDCLKGNEVPIFSVTQSMIDANDVHKEYVDNSSLRDVLNKNRILSQKEISKYIGRGKSVTKIFLTPIVGVIHQCSIRQYDGTRIGYFGTIYVAEEFKFDAEFWQSFKGEYLRKHWLFKRVSYRNNVKW